MGADAEMREQRDGQDGDQERDSWAGTGRDGEGRGDGLEEKVLVVQARGPEFKSPSPT